MYNILSLDEFIEERIRLYCSSTDVLNESMVRDFYKDIFNKISKITNERILVINSVSFAESLSSESSMNNIVCIYSDESFEIPEETNVEYRYVNFCMNSNEISVETSNMLKDVFNEFFKNDFDKIFNFSLPMKGGWRYDHVSKLNYKMFKMWFVPGVTSWYSFDEYDVQEQFSKIVYSKEKYKIGATLKIENDVWKSSGFDGDEDRYLTHIFVRESGIMGGLPAEELDREDTIGSYEDISDGILKHYVEPRIYSFRSDMVDGVIAPNTALKVGDTNRGVSVRMEEWRKKFPDLKLLNDWSAVVSGCGDGLDGKVFRDYDVHKILESWGKNRIKKETFGEDNIKNGRYSNEFFYDTTPEDVEKAISHIHKLIRESRYEIISRLTTGKRIKKKYVEPIHDQHIKFKERDLQTQTIEKFAERFVAGDKDLLMYAVMRFGKTYTACRCAQEFAGKFTVIVSAKADVKGEWLSAVNPYKEFENYDMYVVSGDGSLYDMLNKNIKEDGKKTLDEYFKEYPDKHIMLFITLQDLSGYVKGKKSDRKRVEFECFINTPVDLLIIDEAHYGPQGEEYGKGIGEGWDMEEGDIDKDEKYSVSETKEYIETLNLSDVVKLHLSGTPYDLVARGKFSMESIIARFGFDDLMEKKQEWIDENIERIKSGEITLDKNPYFGIPQMIQFGYNFDDFGLENVLEYGKADFLHLFEVTGMKGSRRFKHEEDILNMLKAIDGSERKENVMAILDSPSLKKEKMCKHIVMVLPRKEMCDVMEDLLLENKGNLKNIGEYKVINIASKRAGIKTEDAKDIIRNEDEAGNKTISLTVIQMLTGVSVKEWDTMFYMKDGMTAQPYDQSRFRIQTPNIGEREVLSVTDDGKSAKPLLDEHGKVVTIKIDKKPQTLFVDFSTERFYKVLYDRFETQCKMDGRTSGAGIYGYMLEKYKEFVRFMPIITNSVGVLQEVDAENIMIKIFDAYQKSVLKGKSDAERIFNMDFTSTIDIKDVDLYVFGGLDSSYTGGGDTKKTSGIEDRMLSGKGDVTPIPEMIFEDPEFKEEIGELGLESTYDEIITSEKSGVEDDGGSDSSELDIDIEPTIDYERETKERINNISKTLMKNILIYMLCRNDDIKVFDNIHDLVWDSMRRDGNQDVILNIFDPKHAGETDERKRIVYVQQVRYKINEWNKKILMKNETVLKQVIAMIVGACLSKSDRSDFDKVKNKLYDFGKGAIGKTEFITPEPLIKKMITSEDVVIFNKDSRILDCYGSKVGEILYYINENYDHNIDNYYFVCNNTTVAELNKLVMKIVLNKQGRKFKSMLEREKYLNEHVLVYNTTESESSSEVFESRKSVRPKEDKTALPGLEMVIERKWKDMKFDVVVGNPPYGVAQKGSIPNLHLKIMNTIIKFCLDKLVFIMPSKPITVKLDDKWYNIFKNAVCNRIDVVGKDVFSGTEMDNTAIYYCDRHDLPENYCKKLDVDKVIYYAIENETHRLFIDKMGLNKELLIFLPFVGHYDEKSLEKTLERLNDGKYYLNVNRVSVKPGEGISQWISNTLREVGILTKDEEIEYCKANRKRKEILECPTKEYGENLKNLMVDGLVLRYSLWLTQNNQAIYQAQFRYVPDLDYTFIHSDEELLATCGFTEDEITKVMDYLKHFDFSQNRNDIVRSYSGVEISEEE